MRRSAGCVLTVLLPLTAIAAHAAEPAMEESGRLYTQQDMARLVAEALAGGGDDAAVLSVEFANPLPTLRTPPGAEPIVVEEISTDPAGRRFVARVAMPVGSGNVHRQTLTGQFHRLAEVPVLARPVGRGETIQAEDLEWVRLKDSRLGTSTIVDAGNLVGHTARGPLRPGTPVRASQVRKPVVVAKGSSVLVVFERQGMALSARARALEDGGVGEVVRVSNLQSNTVVEGTVTGPGRVDVSVPGQMRRGGRS